MAMTRTTKTDKSDELDELHERLSAQVEPLISGNDWAAMLDIAADCVHPNFVDPGAAVS